MLRISVVSQVLPACQTWYDHVWAYFKTLVDVQVEKVTVGHTLTACCDTVLSGVWVQTLRSRMTPPERDLVELPSEYWTNV